jgi:hypothetical protein
MTLRAGVQILPWCNFSFMMFDIHPFVYPANIYQLSTFFRKRAEPDAVRALSQTEQRLSSVGAVSHSSSLTWGHGLIPPLGFGAILFLQDLRGNRGLRAGTLGTNPCLSLLTS